MEDKQVKALSIFPGNLHQSWQVEAAVTQVNGRMKERGFMTADDN